MAKTDNTQVKQQQQQQRTGYTTGSCATAASRAALRIIMCQDATTAHNVDITLPRGGTLTIPTKCVGFTSKDATCTVIKDGGDDPDVTHGASIVVDLSITNDNPGVIQIEGGEGVGVVTKPGLGLEIGKPAINPVPKKMIKQNLEEEAAKKTDFLNTHGIKVTITVPRGRELGPKTDNPRLGIIGGISILGTSGIVIPFSTAAYAASIRQSLDVAVAMNEKTVILTTGGRSEEFAKKTITGEISDHCFVQMGDFVGYTVRECAKRSEQFEKMYVVGFIGKLAKMATGVRQTHVKGSKVDMKFLAKIAEDAGATDDTIQAVKKANTARHVSEIISSKTWADKFFEILCSKVCIHMMKHAQSDINITVILFGFDGNILARAETVQVN